MSEENHIDLNALLGEGYQPDSCALRKLICFSNILTPLRDQRGNESAGKVNLEKALESVYIKLGFSVYRIIVKNPACPTINKFDGVGHMYYCDGYQVSNPHLASVVNYYRPNHHKSDYDDDK